MNYSKKRVNKHLIINNYLYFKDFSLGLNIGYDEKLYVSIDLIFIGLEIIF